LEGYVASLADFRICNVYIMQNAINKAVHKQCFIRPENLDLDGCNPRTNLVVEGLFLGIIRSEMPIILSSGCSIGMYLRDLVGKFMPCGNSANTSGHTKRRSLDTA
jgi:hypothetical protein